MNESFDEFSYEFARPRANTCPSGNLRRPRLAEFSASPDRVDPLRVPSPPDSFGELSIDIARCLKSSLGVDAEAAVSSAHDAFLSNLEEALEPGGTPFASAEVSSTAQSCSSSQTTFTAPGVMPSPSSSQESDGAGKKKRRNPWGSETYAELISKAIEARPDRRATLQQIYKFIINYNKFFRDRSEGSLSAGWKNSIRHNLSLQAKFVKVGKTLENSKSSYWTIDDHAAEKKTYLRRRCVTLDKQSEAVARRKLMNRCDLFNDDKSKLKPGDSSSTLPSVALLPSAVAANADLLHQPQPEMPLFSTAGPMAPYDRLRTGSNASQSSRASLASEVTSSSSFADPNLNVSPFTPPRGQEAAPTTDAQDVEMDEEEFERAQMELALLVAECCYLNQEGGEENGSGSEQASVGQVNMFSGVQPRQQVQQQQQQQQQAQHQQLQHQQLQHQQPQQQHQFSQQLQQHQISHEQQLQQQSYQQLQQQPQQQLHQQQSQQLQQQSHQQQLHQQQLQQQLQQQSHQRLQQLPQQPHQQLLQQPHQQLQHQNQQQQQLQQQQSHHQQLQQPQRSLYQVPASYQHLMSISMVSQQQLQPQKTPRFSFDEFLLDQKRLKEQQQQQPQVPAKDNTQMLPQPADLLNPSLAESVSENGHSEVDDFDDSFKELFGKPDDPLLDNWQTQPVTVSGQSQGMLQQLSAPIYSSANDEARQPPSGQLTRCLPNESTSAAYNPFEPMKMNSHIRATCSSAQQTFRSASFSTNVNPNGYTSTTTSSNLQCVMADTSKASRMAASMDNLAARTNAVAAGQWPTVIGQYSCQQYLGFSAAAQSAHVGSSSQTVATTLPHT